MTPTGRISKNGQWSFPVEDRAKNSPEWNHYRIVATNGMIRLSMNGQEVTVGRDCRPRKGYLCLESEGSACHFRNLRLRDLLFYEYPDNWLPEDYPWWLRKEGQRQQFWPGTHRMNWNDPDYRRHVVRQTVSLQQSGVGGVFYDNLREEPEPWVAFLKEVREAVGDRFLILANSGYAVGRHDFAAPFINGFMYESGWSHQRTEWDEVIRKMQHSESWLRTPRISIIERFEETRDHAGWPGDARLGQKPPEDVAARRWSLCYALAIGDFFYLFSDNTSHRHDWYPEYDHRIGQPLAPGERVNSHVWRRAYEKALVVVNLPGAKEPFTCTLENPGRDTLIGETGVTFVIPPGDGRILAKP